MLIPWLLAGCVPAEVAMEFDDDADGLVNEDRYGTDPTNPDSDGDNHLDGEEALAGFDPLDADDHPYTGGWEVGFDCRDDVQPTGDGEGDVIASFSLPDQHGDSWKLHDFCHREIYLYATMFG